MAGWAVAVVAVLAAATAAVAVRWAQHRRMRELATAVNRWLGADAHQPVTVPGSRAWKELGIAVNALGAAYGRRGDKLRRERPWRRHLVDGITLPSLLFGPDGHLIVANEPARRELSLTREQPLTALQALGSAALADAVEAARESRGPVELEASIDDRDLWAVASPVGDEVLLVLADRTAQRRLGEIRRDFVSNASHELKTPVAGIQALVDALDVVVDDDPARARELVARLAGEADRLNRLVHDLLDLQRLEDAGPGDREPVDLVEVVEAELARLAGTASARGIEVTTDLPTHAPLAAHHDDVRLIVANLLDNAIQYTDAGGRIRVAVEPRGGAHELVVEDTGVGIPREDLARIFERFYRVDVARSRESGGTGLGLSIVRHAAERQGGRVRVESLLGEGSTFRVVLPVEPLR